MSLDNLRHAQYGDDGRQIDDPQSVLRVSQALAPLQDTGGNISGVSRTLNFELNPIGFNSYELLYQYLLDSTYAYQAVISYIRACGADLARIMFPVVREQEYLERVFVNGIPDRDFVDSDFRTTFLTRTTQVFDACSSSNLKLLLCFNWAIGAVPSLYGETAITSIDGSSRTFKFVSRFARWTAQTFGNHPAIVAYSFINEPVYDVAGVTNATPAKYAEFFSGLIRTVRAEAPRWISTTDIVPFTLNTSWTRPNFETEIDNLTTLWSTVDAVGVHVYGYGPSQVGMSYIGNFGVTTAAYGPATTNNLGFEGLESFLSAMKAIADGLGKPLWITETGVPIDVEANTSNFRRAKLLATCVRYAQVTLVWNTANVAAPIANQVVWQIRPGQPLATTYQNTILPLNKARISLIPVGKGGGLPALLARKRPSYCFTSTRAAGATVRFSSIAAHTTSTQAVMFWLRRNAAMTNFENFLSVRGAGNLSGFVALAGSVAATDSDYIDFRAAAGSAIATASRLPRRPDNEWIHYAYVLRTVNEVAGVELWLDGLFYGTIACNNTYVGIPAGITGYCGGNSAGTPVSMQDITFCADATPEDIWAHMEGVVLPQATLHLRASGAGVLDLSRNAVAVTVGAGVITQPA